MLKQLNRSDGMTVWVNASLVTAVYGEPDCVKIHMVGQPGGGRGLPFKGTVDYVAQILNEP